MTKRKTLISNQKGSAIIQSMIVAAMVATLSGSLSTLNLGQAKAAIQFLKNAEAQSIAHTISMHLTDPDLCSSSINAGALPNITPGNHGANGIPIRMYVKYPSWANTNGLAAHPTTGEQVKLLPINSANNEDNQFGGTRIYIEDIRFRLPMAGGVFDNSEGAIRPYTLPDGAGGLLNLVRYTGEISITLKDNSSLPIPIVPITMGAFINVDVTNPGTPVFHSCTADLGLEETCERTMGCSWETINPNSTPPGEPYNPPFCRCNIADSATCGADEYIADFDSATGQPICRPFLHDCTTLRGPGYFISGIEADGTTYCQEGGEVIIDYLDCAPQLKRWQVGADVCEALVPAIGGSSPPVGVYDLDNITLTDSTGPTTGSANFVCQTGQLLQQPGATCTSPAPTFVWQYGPWSGCAAGATPTPTPACFAAGAIVPRICPIGSSGMTPFVAPECCSGSATGNCGAVPLSVALDIVANCD